ncbi:FixH family protein [Pontibacter sp. 172403-2]|uniref:FixH family protein n=1 Tax=Pontibacter rufus TaxID=2791028 RepID=UPI0018AFA43A|nr:FixH family protein [Pontibacter sp. 172403-2]MBF9254154.1 FixH family protein [Pontibacter sp. 172403-2]
MATNQDKNKSFTIWPYAVVTAMLLFMGYIASFVYRAMSQDVDLVSTNYYEQELAYQDHMNTVGRTRALGEVAVNYDAAAQTILLQLPESFAGKNISGKINFFRPSDDKLDFELPLQPDANQRQLLNAGKLQKGLWKVRLNYSAAGENYYTEQTIIIE